jgi:outer membrane protein assembly factor BamE (lipoprotein component of BamABCDE complex)
MNAAWAHFYQTRFDGVFEQQTGKTEDAKKKKADKVIKDQWLELSELQRKRMITKVRNQNKEQEAKPEEVKATSAKKRKTPESKKSASPVPNKRQKKN